MASQLPLDIAGILSVWMECLLFGIYASLFIQTVFLMWKQRLIRTGPSKIFFWGTLLMFLIAATHVALNFYRLLRGYVWLREEVGPENYFLDLGRWDNVAHNALNAIMTWVADCLIIYRCFIVWNHNYYIIIVPSLLLIMSIIANGIALKEFTDVPLGTIFGATLVHWMNTIYALAFVQNVMTTGLIAWRIWRQEKESVNVGIHSADSRSSLLPIVRIIIESAMIYVVELLVLIILYALKHNAQFVVQEAVVPTVGIVFTLMTIRISKRSYKVHCATVTEDQSRPIQWRARSVGPMVTTEYTTTADDIDMKPIGPFQIQDDEDSKYEETYDKTRGRAVV
ncbi:hypothetical protein PLEOSDRAFT_157989 [Pleurotus ostreatus PC15]|uniref:Uncharacterized protein n=1 Tax=Pleurotus ostreatus (strain PC15) TaxID=1137138 RepID=A0A067NJP4_PLEO1|nr:hypothetical protein PLEOSDRAFT_157989 [Pleurotus ostreatus PC15]